MKQFFGAFFGSLLGVVITGIAAALIIVFTLISSVKDAMDGLKGLSEEEIYIPKENSVLRLNLNPEIRERGVKKPFSKLGLGAFTGTSAIGLDDILGIIRRAEKDDNIKGIYLNVSSPGAGFATMEEIRNALLEFKKSGKFIYAYSEVYSQRAYYMASVADQVFVNPQGGLELKGLSAQLMFYKKMLDKLDVDVQIFRHGKFKSAIEPYMLDKMSDANREQIETYIGSIWNTMLTGISVQRNIAVADLNAMADNLTLRTTEDLVTNKLVDALAYEDEVMDKLRAKLKMEKDKEIRFVRLSEYAKNIDKPATSASGDNQIAVIYAVGEIVSGEGSDDNMGSDRIAKAIREAREDKDIKAIVLRVNSPGGSALASDVMWREVTLAKKMKPVIVSMGDVAASGGYYISCAADRIFAQPNTITGSIGVFGILPNAQRALAQKLGITIDTANTNKHSDMGTPFRPLTKLEFEVAQQGVEQVYDVFTSRVAEGRNIAKTYVDSIGQGRVWSGSDALAIHLVDELGGIKNAISYAATKAKLKTYKLVAFPKQKDPLEELFSSGADEVEGRILSKNLGDQYIYLKQLKQVMEQKGVQARLPFQLLID